MVFNLDFANNSILSCFFSFLLIIDQYFLIPSIIEQNFNHTAELVIPIEISAKKAKAEMETHPGTVEITIKRVHSITIKRVNNSKLFKLFYVSYLLFHFRLLLQ